MSCVFAWLGRGLWCGPNCGERYWGDFYSDPPDCQDPCDCHGNYAGGYQGDIYNDGTVYSGGNQGGGCKNCGHNHAQHQVMSDGGESVGDGNVVSDRVVPSTPSSNNQPHRAARPQ